jgi:membrane protein YdbS with pleckstrin-like domain
MDKLHFSKKNSLVLLIAIVLLTIGYLILNTGDITISPIILVFAYCVVIPLSFIIGTKKKEK